MSNIIFLDASFRNTGVFIAEVIPSGYKPIHSCVIITKKENKVRKIRATDDDVRGCTIIARDICSLIKEYDVKAVAVELPHGGSKSQRASRTMGLVTGVIAAVEEMLEIPFLHVTPSEVKVAMTGKKSCGKTEIKEKALTIYPEFEKYKKNTKDGFDGKFEHIADAVGVSEVVKDDPIVRILRQGVQ